MIPNSCHHGHEKVINPMLTVTISKKENVKANTESFCEGIYVQLKIEEVACE